MNNMLTVNLAGRIDANNAEENESRITSELAASHENVPVFDAENLEYISSAGLRMLLKFRNISFEGCPVIGEGAPSKVYRLDPETIVKVFTHPHRNILRPSL